MLIFLFFLALMIAIIVISIKRSVQVGIPTRRTMRALGANSASELGCVAGLPVAQGATVTMYDGPSQLTFARDGDQWVLPKSRILSLDLVKGSSIQRGGGADASLMAAGYVLAGIPGAALGAVSGSGSYLSVLYTASDGAQKSMLYHVPPGEEGRIRSLVAEVSRSRSDQPTRTTNL